MNFLEAIKSGNQIKRQGWNYWIIVNAYGNDFFARTYYGDSYPCKTTLACSDVLAEDWESKDNKELKNTLPHKYEKLIQENTDLKSMIKYLKQDKANIVEDQKKRLEQALSRVNNL